MCRVPLSLTQLCRAVNGGGLIPNSDTHQCLFVDAARGAALHGFGMADFRLDADDLQTRLARARARAASDAIVTAACDQARSASGLTPDDMAVLWFAETVDCHAMYALAHAARARRPVALETFSPLYMTNTCDAECRMCGMRRDNDALQRETADLDQVIAQLHVLQRRGMHAVSLLTGEYRAARRPWALRYVNLALRAALDLGFAHTLINVGSIDADEFAALLDGVPRRDDGSVLAKLTMCTFQETYSRSHYVKFMGNDPDNPRADYDRRLANFDRSYRAGLRVANPGILVGLNADLAFELMALALHAQHLLALGMEVYLSVPRLRQIAGGRSQGGVNDQDFIRLVSLLSVGLPTCKIVVTTREDSAMQHTLVPIATVLSAGSAAVTPYTESGARFPLQTSQFEVIDQRPFEEVLRAHHQPGSPIINFDPPATSHAA
jgi:2-iminoacetate synthase ThiH